MPKWQKAMYLQLLRRCRRCLGISSIGWPDDGEYYDSLVVGFILRRDEVIHTVFYLEDHTTEELKLSKRTQQCGTKGTGTVYFLIRFAFRHIVVQELEIPCEEFIVRALPISYYTIFFDKGKQNSFGRNQSLSKRNSSNYYQNARNCCVVCYVRCIVTRYIFRGQPTAGRRC